MATKAERAATAKVARDAKSAARADKAARVAADKLAHSSPQDTARERAFVAGKLPDADRRAAEAQAALEGRVPVGDARTDEEISKGVLPFVTAKVDLGLTQLPVATEVPPGPPAPLPPQKQPVDRALAHQTPHGRTVRGEVVHADDGSVEHHQVRVSKVMETRRLIAVAEQETGYAQKEALVTLRKMWETV